MTAALEGGEWSKARPGRTLSPGKTRYPFYRRLGGPQGRSRRAGNLVPTGIQSRTVQPVVSHYTNLASRPTFPLAVPSLFLKDISCCLRLLPRLPVSSILLSISPSITCFRKQFLRNVTNPVILPALYFVWNITLLFGSM